MTMQTYINYDQEHNTVICNGDWTLAHIDSIATTANKISFPTSGTVIFDGSEVQMMDSAGAMLICDLEKKISKSKVKIELQNFPPKVQSLLKIVRKNFLKETPLAKRPSENKLAIIGRFGTYQVSEMLRFLSFVGLLTLESLRVLRQPRRLRWGPLANIIYRNGYLALPIIALLAFMIGVVLTYQMGLQLRSYGANIYIVDLLGLATLREFGPLLTAIMVAGRTGSAFTAQLGTMKINQEIDALNTMGVTPTELLLLPRIAGLFIALPLLTIWADIFSILGGIIMSNSMLNITWYDFLHRFPHAVKLKSLMIGLGKAPVFALIIGTIGCFEGMQVSGSADSVGRNTTRSVVLAIFFIIVADAIFSIIFSKLKL